MTAVSFCFELKGRPKTVIDHRVCQGRALRFIQGYQALATTLVPLRAIRSPVHTLHPCPLLVQYAYLLTDGCRRGIPGDFCVRCLTKRYSTAKTPLCWSRRKLKTAININIIILQPRSKTKHNGATTTQQNACVSSPPLIKNTVSTGKLASGGRRAGGGRALLENTDTPPLVPGAGQNA